MRTIKTTLILMLALLTLPAFGAAYIKFDGIDGESKAPGKDKWIELGSLQFANGSCNTPSTGATRRATMSATAVPEKLLQACQTRTRFRSVVVDADGQQHMLENATISGCTPNSAPAGTVTFFIDYASCSSHSPAPATTRPTNPQRGNATLAGVMPAPTAVTLTDCTIAGNTASMSLPAGTYPKDLATTIMKDALQGTSIPSVLVKAGGQQWSFANVMVSSTQASPDGGIAFTINFASFTGDPAAFQNLGKK